MSTAICVKTTYSDAINTTPNHSYVEASKKHGQFSLKHPIETVVTWKAFSCVSSIIRMLWISSDKIPQVAAM